MNYSHHAMERATGRLGEVIAPDIVKALCTLAEKAAETCHGSTAIKLAKLAFVGAAWSNKSNGDTLFAIVRDRRVVTYMFRRSTQPFTTEALRVNALLDFSHLTR